MHLMAARRQFNAEFCTDNAAAAVRGITGYADFHPNLPSCLGFKTLPEDSFP
jgi:hypothetical protein